MIDVMRRVAFAIVAGIAGAWVARVFLTVAFGFPHSAAEILAEPRHAWAAGCATAVLAWLAARSGLAMLGATALAGSLTGTAMVAVGCLALAIEHGPVDMIGVWSRGIIAAALSVPFGLVLGLVSGVALSPLDLGLTRLAARPTVSTTMRALRASAAWAVLPLGLEACIAERPVGASEIATTLAMIALVVATGAAIGVATRSRWVRAVCEGRIAGWSVALDDDGTRWLMREALAGDGAYRDGIVRTRWGRLDA
ncbi:hypothetical protein DB32_008453 [Sandaracinus amylolyticus]|uniref:Uncharacterized protein n=1 Tax=Sandaracinus amylolyticus TaxID=927083 RepID=A0A0F6SHZ5_9BACT|nr:hypothetical protein DB32_008453 [Sandaracinus amylolyticus]